MNILSVILAILLFPIYAVLFGIVLVSTWSCLYMIVVWPWWYLFHRITGGRIPKQPPFSYLPHRKPFTEMPASSEKKELPLAAVERRAARRLGAVEVWALAVSVSASREGCRTVATAEGAKELSELEFTELLVTQWQDQDCDYVYDMVEKLTKK